MELSGCSRIFDAEKIVLGLIFKNKTHLVEAKKADLEDSDFSDPFHSTIFSLMVEAAEQKLNFTPESLAQTMPRKDIIKLMSISNRVDSNKSFLQLVQEIKDEKALKTVQDLLVMISLRIEQRRPRAELLPFIAAIEKLNEDMKSN